MYSTDGRVRVGCWKRAMNWYTSSGISVLTGNPARFQGEEAQSVARAVLFD